MLNRRHFIAAAGAALASPALAQEMSLTEISNYLRGLRSAYARFTQINPDNSRSQGQLFMRRPGRIRFEYDAPDDSLVIAGQGDVVLFDARSNEPPQRFQLANTPLKLILQTDVDLTTQRMVVGSGVIGDETYFTAQDPRFPEYGALQLYFSAKPQLTRWITIDGGGSRTMVVLEGIEENVSIPERLFDVEAEMAKRGF